MRALQTILQNYLYLRYDVVVLKYLGVTAVSNFNLYGGMLGNLTQSRKCPQTSFKEAVTSYRRNRHRIP